MADVEQLGFDDDSFGLSSLILYCNELLARHRLDLEVEGTPSTAARYTETVTPFVNEVLIAYSGGTEFTAKQLIAVINHKFQCWLNSNFGAAFFIIYGGEPNPGPSQIGDIAISTAISNLVKLMFITSVNSARRIFLKNAARASKRPRTIVVVMIVSLLIYKKSNGTTDYFRKFCGLLGRRLTWLRFNVGARLFSRLIQASATPPLIDNRRVFKDLQVQSMTTRTATQSHSHASAADNRCVANTAIEIFTDLLGKKIYSIAPSNADNRLFDSSRNYFTAKDLQQQVKSAPLTPQHIIKLIDVDYYIDLSQVLVNNDVIIYTFVPQAVAGTTADGVYTTDCDNNVVTSVHGGATYRHQLWDFDTDHIAVDHWWGTTVYLVEQSMMAHDRRLVYFNMIRKVYGPWAWFMPGERLSRKQLVHGDLAHMRVMALGYKEINGTMTVDPYMSTVGHSIGLVGDTESALVPDGLFTTTYVRVAHSARPAISDVERLVRGANLKDPIHLSTVLFEFLQSNAARELIDRLRQKELITQTYQPKTGFYQTLAPLQTEDAKPVMRSLHPPLCLGVAHPGRSHNNDQSCVSGRVYATRNQTITYPPFYWNCLHEFITRCVPNEDMHTLVPNDFETQFATLKRPSQRGFLNAVQSMLFHDSGFSVKAFLKAESYAKVTNPRNISTLPPGHNFRLGAYIYPVTDLLKRTSYGEHGPWYAFGLHPRQLSDVMYTKAIFAANLTECDVDRNDGSTPYIYSVLDAAILMRAYAPEFHPEIQRLNAKERYAGGITASGLRYTSADQTLSGSSKTSFRNTIGDAYAHYVALRYTYEPDDAWNRLGMYGGDDSITPDMPASTIEGVFAKLGMSVRATTRPVTQPCGFLGRIYLNLSVSSHSIIDPMRHIIKVHMTHQPREVPDNIAARQKAESMLITDPGVPIISHWARMILRVFPEASEAEMTRCRKYLLNDVYYWSKFDSPFAIDVPQEPMTEVVCDSLSVTKSELDDMCAVLDNIKTLDQLQQLQPLINREMRVDTPAAVDGEIMMPTDKDGKCDPSIVPVAHATKVLAAQSKSQPAPKPTRAEAVQARKVRSKMAHQTGPPNQPLSPNSALCWFVEAGATCTNKRCRFSHDLNKVQQKKAVPVAVPPPTPAPVPTQRKGGNFKRHNVGSNLPSRQLTKIVPKQTHTKKPALTTVVLKPNEKLKVEPVVRIKQQKALAIAMDKRITT